MARDGGHPGAVGLGAQDRRDQEHHGREIPHRRVILVGEDHGRGEDGEDAPRFADGSEGDDPALRLEAAEDEKDECGGGVEGYDEGPGGMIGRRGDPGGDGGDMNEEGDGERACAAGDWECLIEWWPVWQFRLLDAAFDLWFAGLLSGAAGVLVALFVRFRYIGRTTDELITIADMLIAMVSAAVVFGSLISALELLGG